MKSYKYGTVFCFRTEGVLKKTYCRANHLRSHLYFWTLYDLFWTFLINVNHSNCVIPRTITTIPLKCQINKWSYWDNFHIRGTRIPSLFLMLNCIVYPVGFLLGCFDTFFLFQFYYWPIIISWAFIFLETFSSCVFIWCKSLWTKLLGFWIWLTTKQLFIPPQTLLYVIIFLHIFNNNLRGHNALTCEFIGSTNI